MSSPIFTFSLLFILNFGAGWCAKNTFADRISVSRERSDIVICDEVIASAIAEEKSAIDDPLADDRKLTEKVNKANNIAFQPALPHHAEHLTKLSLESNAHWNYRNAHPKVINQVLNVTKDNIKSETIRLMMEEDEIVGFFGLRSRQNRLMKTINELSYLFIKKDRIGKGYGKILFQEAVRVAKEELKWRAILWESDPFAAGFYRKMGAVQIGCSPCPLNNKYTSPLFVMVFEE